MPPQPHTSHFRVYYEDTDAGGVVYYANYLKFAERARTEMLRDHGMMQSTLPCFFVVRHAELDLMKPARLDDLLTVHTRVLSLGKASFTLTQAILSSGSLLAELKVKIACVSPEFRPIKLPATMNIVLESL